MGLFLYRLVLGWTSKSNFKISIKSVWRKLWAKIASYLTFFLSQKRQPKLFTTIELDFCQSNFLDVKTYGSPWPILSTTSRTQPPLKTRYSKTKPLCIILYALRPQNLRPSNYPFRLTQIIVFLKQSQIKRYAESRQPKRRPIGQSLNCLFGLFYLLFHHPGNHKSVFQFFSIFLRSLLLSKIFRPTPRLCSTGVTIIQKQNLFWINKFRQFLQMLLATLLLNCSPKSLCLLLLALKLEILEHSKCVLQRQYSCQGYDQPRPCNRLSSYQSQVSPFYLLLHHPGIQYSTKLSAFGDISSNPALVSGMASSVSDVAAHTALPSINTSGRKSKDNTGPDAKRLGLYEETQPISRSTLFTLARTPTTLGTPAAAGSPTEPVNNTAILLSLLPAVEAARTTTWQAAIQQLSNGQQLSERLLTTFPQGAAPQPYGPSALAAAEPPTEFGNFFDSKHLNSSPLQGLATLQGASCPLPRSKTDQALLGTPQSHVESQ